MQLARLLRMYSQYKLRSEETGLPHKIAMADVEMEVVAPVAGAGVATEKAEPKQDLSNRCGAVAVCVFRVRGATCGVATRGLSTPSKIAVDARAATL